jgi:hypothetical protein
MDARENNTNFKNRLSEAAAKHHQRAAGAAKSSPILRGLHAGLKIAGN